MKEYTGRKAQFYLKNKALTQVKWINKSLSLKNHQAIFICCFQKKPTGTKHFEQIQNVFSGNKADCNLTSSILFVKIKA
ncbi:MAG TPA: hypothetical protein DCX89_07515 [Saprospirales bacterium]|nr:hypothetical protein [Saprospirales bacterium]HAY71725.1 hypothetical protein [Saprospirales bacterium]